MAKLEIRSADVLAGTGKGVYMHPGNVRMRQLAADSLDYYEKCRRGEKTQVAEGIVKAIRDASGRFLNKTCTAELPERQIIKKIQQVLRDMRGERLAAATTTAAAAAASCVAPFVTTSSPKPPPPSPPPQTETLSAVDTDSEKKFEEYSPIEVIAVTECATNEKKPSASSSSDEKKSDNYYPVVLEQAIAISEIEYRGSAGDDAPQSCVAAVARASKKSYSEDQGTSTAIAVAVPLEDATLGPPPPIPVAMPPVRRPSHCSYDTKDLLIDDIPEVQACCNDSYASFLDVSWCEDFLASQNNTTLPRMESAVVAAAAAPAVAYATETYHSGFHVRPMTRTDSSSDISCMSMDDLPWDEGKVEEVNNMMDFAEV